MFSIFRSHTAQTPLREAWEQGNQELRQAIWQASERVDSRLRQCPLEEGESREAPARVLFQAPVGVLFAVDGDKRLVTILRSWVYRAREDKDQ